VSVVHALTGDERIVAAFPESIGETMAELEAEMQTQVRKDSAESDRHTGNMLWQSSFTSRAGRWTERCARNYTPTASRLMPRLVEKQG
jgi:hypothetical protein